MQLHSDWRTCAFLKMLWLVERNYGLCSSVYRMQCISSNKCVLHIKGRTHFSFSSNAACVSCCETSWRILCSATPFSWKVQVWGHSATMPKVVAISPIWARQPQLFSMRLIPGKDKGVRKSALSSTRPSRNFLEKITTKCAQRWNSTICGAWHETTMFKSNQGGFGYKPLDTHFSIFIPKVSKSKYWWRLIICQRPSRGNLEPMTLSSSLDSRLIHNLGNPLLPQPTWCV